MVGEVFGELSAVVTGAALALALSFAMFEEAWVVVFGFVVFERVS